MGLVAFSRCGLRAVICWALVACAVWPTASVASSGPAYDKVIEASYSGGWGVELGVYKNGRPLYVHSYGLRDRGLPNRFNGSNFWQIEQPDKLFHLKRGKFAPDAATAFDMGSVSKEFTGGAILLLQQDGKLSVDDPLSKYFPGFPNGDAISLLYLLQHRSGLVDYNQFGGQIDFTQAYGAFMASGQEDYTPIVNQLATYPLLFTPGTQYNYSNTDYLLLGLIVAQVAGEPLGSFLAERIFSPLTMHQTAQGYPSPPVTDLWLGYRTISVRFAAPGSGISLGSPARRHDLDRRRHRTVGPSRPSARHLYERIAQADVHQEPDSRVVRLYAMGG